MEKVEVQEFYRSMGFDENQIVADTQKMFEIVGQKDAIDFPSFKHFMGQYKNKLPNMRQIEKMFETMHYQDEADCLTMTEMMPLFELLFDTVFGDDMIQQLYDGYSKNIDIQNLVW